MTPGSDRADAARVALAAIVGEPDLGPAVLADPAALSAILTDYLPGAPRETGPLLAAAQADVAGMLREHAARGMDPATAIRLAAAHLAASTSYSSEACLWASGELAIALGLTTADRLPQLAPQGEGTVLAAAPGAVAGPDVAMTGQATGPPEPARSAGEPAGGSAPAGAVPSPLASQRARGAGSRSGQARLMLAGAGTALVAVAAAAVVVVLVAQRGHGQAGRSPPPPATSRSVSHSSAPTVTRVLVYEPWASSGFAHAISAHATITGQCFATSLTTGRDDAYRCTSGNELLDPCFSNPNSASGSGQVACPYPSPDSVTIINLTAELPTAPPGQASAPSPWLVILTDGRRCWSTSGAAGFQVAGLANTFACGGGLNLFGPPRRGTTWTILHQAKGQATLTPTTIVTVYE
jgi:hypothetical protein